MTIEARGPEYLSADKSAYDLEQVSLASVDYVPTNANGAVVTCRGLTFTGQGDIKVDTPGGTGRTIPSGSFTIGNMVPVEFTKIYKSGTTATGIVAYT